MSTICSVFLNTQYSGFNYFQSHDLRRQWSKDISKLIVPSISRPFDASARAGGCVYVYVRASKQERERERECLDVHLSLLMWSMCLCVRVCVSVSVLDNKHTRWHTPLCCFGLSVHYLYFSVFLPHLPPLPPPSSSLPPLSYDDWKWCTLFNDDVCFKITCQSVSLSPLLPSRGRPQDEKSGHSTSCLIFYLCCCCCCVCMCARVCVCVCIYIYIYINVCVCIRVCVCVGVRVHTQEYVHTCLCVFEHSAVSVH